MHGEWRFRLRDVLVSSLLLALCSPVFLVLAVLIPRDSQGPVMFRQIRVSRGGAEFRIHKFRSMTSKLSGPSVSTSTDIRITRLGRLIRISKLDELPQLIDVFQGKMSLVGPRPELPEYVSHWPRELRPIILSVRPGITDPATVILRNEAEYLARFENPERAYVEHLLPAKARIYSDYVRGRSFSGDIRIVWATVRAIIRPEPVTERLIERLIDRSRGEHE
ncbi:MAG TPA: sugar transferase [Microbacterium sp.]|nr:sugar transferase [Microbacterium sp.]